MTSSSDNKSSNFRAVASSYLAQRGMTQASLATVTGQHAAYTNHIFTGRRLPQPEWLDIMATAMQLSDEERKKLHYAAALDHGFKL